MSKIVNDAVGSVFKPLDPVRAARRIVLGLIGTGVLAVVATTVASPLVWFVWAWLAWRVFGIVLLLTVVGPANAERERRLSSIPPGIRRFLITGEEQ